MYPQKATLFLSSFFWQGLLAWKGSIPTWLVCMCVCACMLIFALCACVWAVLLSVQIVMFLWSFCSNPQLVLIRQGMEELWEGPHRATPIPAMAVVLIRWAQPSLVCCGHWECALLTVPCMYMHVSRRWLHCRVKLYQGRQSDHMDLEQVSEMEHACMHTTHTHTLSLSPSIHSLTKSKLTLISFSRNIALFLISLSTSSYFSFSCLSGS